MNTEQRMLNDEGKKRNANRIIKLEQGIVIEEMLSRFTFIFIQ